MELLIFILLIIITFLIYFLLKKERILGINLENDNKSNTKIIETKNYRSSIYNLLNYIPEGVLILDKSKKILFSNNSATNWFVGDL